MSDPAENETDARKQSGFASTFDRLVESNLQASESNIQLAKSNIQLAKTVTTAIVIITVCSILSMSWEAVSTYTMRSTLAEIHTMLQSVLDTLAKARP